jgi:Dolichyl-phosphate-mannose-protein mannosyltransferase
MVAEMGAQAVAARSDIDDVSTGLGGSGSTDGSRSDRSLARHLVPLLLAPLLASIAVLLVASERLDAPFSPDFVGFNTAVWASGSQAVGADGWWESRLGATGGESASEVPYAHHPPLVRIEVAVAESLLGQHRWVDRLPALLSSLAAIWICWGWLGACGFSPGPRSLGLLAVAGTSFFLTYGAMLNMEAAWLPLAFALLWAWQSAERRGGGFWTCFVLGVVGCTAAHQGMLLTAGLALWGLTAAWRQHRRPRAHELGVTAAAATGVAAFLVWVVWASGGISDLMRIARQRTGNGVTWTGFATTQVEHSLSVFGLVGCVCVVAGLFLVRTRKDLLAPMVVLCGVALAYAVGFREGAVIHEYWNVALVPVVALGGALLGERIARTSTRAVVGVCVAVGLLTTIAAVSARQMDHRDGAGLMARAAGARGVPVLYSNEIVSDWLTYESGVPARPAYDCHEVRAVARRDGDATVLVSREWVDARRPGGWSTLASTAGTTTTSDGFGLTTARDLAAVC